MGSLTTLLFSISISTNVINENIISREVSHICVLLGKKCDKIILNRLNSSLGDSVLSES